MGDIALLEPGEIAPCDGIFISGHNVKCDESGASGESDDIKKVTYKECLALAEKELQEAREEGAVGGGEGGLNKGRGSHTDCFILSGSKVVEGVGSYVVIAVGEKSFHGRNMMGKRLSSLKFRP